MRFNTLPMLFGLYADGDLRHVSEVKGGKACNCRCPKCGAKLVARKGRKILHHFAHFFVAECPGGAETALHLFAKRSLVEAKRLRLPGLEDIMDYRSSKGTVKAVQNQQPTQQHIYRAKSAAAEQAHEQHRLDVLMTDEQGYQLAIELKVSHAVDDYKVRRLVRTGQDTIEIDLLAIFRDLQDFYERPPTEEELKIAIVFGKKHRKWLFNRQLHGQQYRRRKRAEVRKIRILSRPDYCSYLVRDCPDEQRQKVKYADHYRYTYARLYHECHVCPHCVEIEYDYEWIGFKRIPVRPARVLCNKRKAG